MPNINGKGKESDGNNKQHESDVCVRIIVPNSVMDGHDSVLIMDLAPLESKNLI